MTPFGRAHSILLFWTIAGEPEPGWYVNLQDPLRAMPLGWDTRDHALDLLVRRDGTWTWKDEDHLASAVGYGHIQLDLAAAIRAEGERVVREWPFPTGWEDWQPDADWPIPTLPDGWNGVF